MFRYAVPALSLLLAGCITLGDSDEPIASLRMPAPVPGSEKVAIVVLPGFGHGAGKLRDEGVHAALQRAWPEADVVLTSATFAYYSAEVLQSRLRLDVIAPLRAEGYETIWLAGGSLGGLGTMLYERHYPGEVTGLVLFAPFLGDDELHEEIADAGGIGAWNPGPVPARVDGDNFAREIWRVAAGWARDPVAAERAWIVCGVDDQHLEESRLLAAALPDGHYLEIDGGHTWATWLRGAEQVAARIRATAATPTP